MRSPGLTLLVLLAGAGAVATASPGGQTASVVLVTTDGLRWQEVFSGAEERLRGEDYAGAVPVAAPPIAGGDRRRPAPAR